MSAGGISFDCLTTSRKVTLPSVDDWGTNLNIIKDPNKGVFTRRKDKVGDTQEILLAQDESGDRIAECINVYARGVNPMVGVSYNNYGKNGGQSGYTKQGGTKLPYRPEVFHPPVYRQENLMPLSRQPREWFYAIANPSINKIIHEMTCPEMKSSINVNVETSRRNVETQKQYIKHLPQFVNNENVSQVHDELNIVDFKTRKQQNSVGTHTNSIEMLDTKAIQETNPYSFMVNKKGSYQKKVDGEKNTEQYVHQKTLKNDNLKTARGSASYFSKIFHDENKRKEATNKRISTNALTSKTMNIEKNNIQRNVDKNIREKVLSLEDGIVSNHQVNRQKIILDASNISLPEKVCINYETNKMIDVYKNPTDLTDMSNIRTKTILQAPYETSKTYITQHKWMGDVPEQRKRVITTSMETEMNKMKPSSSIYNVQGNAKPDIERKRASVGSFDPKPQSVSNSGREHYDYENSDKIHVNNIQQKINSEYSERFRI
jgi:hypothetical protein